MNNRLTYTKTIDKPKKTATSSNFKNRISSYWSIFNYERKLVKSILTPEKKMLNLLAKILLSVVQVTFTFLCRIICCITVFGVLMFHNTLSFCLEKNLGPNDKIYFNNYNAFPESTVYTFGIFMQIVLKIINLFGSWMNFTVQDILQKTEKKIDFNLVDPIIFCLIIEYISDLCLLVVDLWFSDVDNVVSTNVRIKYTNGFLSNILSLNITPYESVFIKILAYQYFYFQIVLGIIIVNKICLLLVGILNILQFVTYLMISLCFFVFSVFLKTSISARDILFDILSKRRSFMYNTLVYGNDFVNITRPRLLFLAGIFLSKIMNVLQTITVLTDKDNLKHTVFSTSLLMSFNIAQLLGEVNINNYNINNYRKFLPDDIKHTGSTILQNFIQILCNSMNFAGIKYSTIDSTQMLSQFASANLQNVSGFFSNFGIHARQVLVDRIVSLFNKTTNNHTNLTKSVFFITRNIMDINTSLSQNFGDINIYILTASTISIPWLAFAIGHPEIVCNSNSYTSGLNSMIFSCTYINFNAVLILFYGVLSLILLNALSFINLNNIFIKQHVNKQIRI